MSAARRFRWLVKLLPPSFRDEYEAEILRTWQAELRDAEREARREPRRRDTSWRDTGRHGSWRRAFVDTLRIAPREHATAFARNVRFAARQLRRTPGFTITAVLTLALGMGATGAVFSLVNAVLLRPLPWRSPEQVGLVWALPPSGQQTWLSFPELEELQRAVSASPASHAAAASAADALPSSALSAVVGIAGMTDIRLPFTAAGTSEEVQVLAVSHGMLRLLGVTPALGRDFNREDDREQAAPVVMLSDAFWRSHFGGDPSIVGRTLTLNDRAVTVIGVLPASFVLLPASSVLPERADMWVPLEANLFSRNRGVRFLHALARLRPDVTFAHADAQVRAHGSRVTREFASIYVGGPWTFTIISFTDDVLKNARGVLSLLFGLVLLVLLIACVNVAHLLLARGDARRAEIAIRIALGAGPVRLAGELLAEACLLTACGSLLGFAFAAATPAVVRSLDGAALPRLADASNDARVAAFMIGLALASVLLSSAAPLIERLWLGRPIDRGGPLVVSTRSGGRTRRSARLGRTLIVLQTAFATTIVVTTLFLVETLVRLQRVDLGFVPRHVMTARVSLSPKYPIGPATTRFFERAVATLARRPGVVDAAAITQLPLSGAMLGSTFLDGPSPESRRIDVDVRVITPRYFTVVGTPVIEGRAFDDRDSATSPGVVIVDEAFARRLNPSGRVIGARVRWFRQPDVELEIVGVVRAVRHRGPADPVRETVYRPLRQSPRTSMFLLAKTAVKSAGSTTVKTAAPSIADAAATPGASAGASLFRGAIDEIDPSQPVADVSTLQHGLDRAVSRPRTSLTIASVLGGLALVLASIGLYGVLSFGVAQRRREFGIRLAVGATPASIGALILAEGVLLTTAGIVAGIGGTVILVRFVRSALFEASAVSVLPHLAGIVLVLLSAMAALALPARRAASVDPIITLRSE